MAEISPINSKFGHFWPKLLILNLAGLYFPRPATNLHDFGMDTVLVFFFRGITAGKILKLSKNQSIRPKFCHFLPKN